MNRNDAEIVSTFNSEIRGLYNFYRIAENVGALHKYYYMVRYSMLKTLAGKHRTNVSAIKKRHMANGVLRIPYGTTKGCKYCEFYHDGFRKHSDGYDNACGSGRNADTKRKGINGLPENTGITSATVSGHFPSPTRNGVPTASSSMRSLNMLRTRKSFVSQKSWQERIRSMNTGRTISRNARAKRC